MKKITLFALAALTASSAFAAIPQVKALQCKSFQSVLNKDIAKETTYFTKEKSISRAEDAISEATPSVYPLYRNFDALYLGWTADLRQFNYPFGFIPSAADVNFYGLFQADSYSWVWNEYTDTGIVEHTSSNQNLSLKTSPFFQFEGPTCEITDAGLTYSYNDSVAGYFAGGAPNMYSQNFAGVGVTPVRYTDDAFRAGYPSVDYTGAEGYNANGTLAVFSSRISKSYSTCTDFKLTGWGSVVPGSSAPFLLKGGYIMLVADAKEATELSIAVMSITDEGKINRNDTIGIGSITLPAGITQGSVNFEVSAKDEILGLSTDQPIVVPTNGVYISITGINNPDAITSIDPLINASTCLMMDLEDYNNEIYNYIIDWNAVLEFDCKSQDGEDVHGLSSCTALYQFEEGADLVPIAEYMIFYDVEYPFIANTTEGYESGDLTIEMPIEGGSTNRFFEANVDIMQLIDDEYVTVEESGDTDWYVFDTEPYEEYPTIFNFLIEAEPLPEGVEGRKATVTFKGYGFDSTITIVQGTPASINEVVATKAKNGKVYDLQGRAVKNATKGIYIMDGKKVIL